jgi:hypothetical protein
MAEKKWIQEAVPPSHEGLFTAKAKAAGMGTQAYARHVLAEDSEADTTTKRQAALARRFSGSGDIGRAVARARRRHSISRRLSS